MYRMTGHWLATDKRFTLSDIRMYLHITSSVDFEGKYSATQASIAQDLNMGRKQVCKSLKFLQGEDLIRQHRVNGHMTYFVNPDYATIGKNRNSLRAVYYSIPNELCKKIDSETVAAY